MIEFNCKNCGRKIKTRKINAGKKADCPACRTPLYIPKLLQEKVKNKITDIPLEQIPADNLKDPGDNVYIHYRRKIHRSEEKPETKLPWFLDIWLYPLNLAGIIHIICLWLLIYLFCPLAASIFDLGYEFIPVVYTLPIAYTAYYFAGCTRECAQGNFRAPDFWFQDNDDK